VVLEETLQGFPFPGDSDKVLFIYFIYFICRGRRICHRKRLQARIQRNALQLAWCEAILHACYVPALSLTAALQSYPYRVSGRD
jgi:hypothetical protein